MLEDGPVEAGRTEIAVARSTIAHHDVIAAFTTHPVGDRVAHEDVVADDRIQPTHVEILAGAAICHSMLDPIVAFVTEDHLDWPNTKDEVIAWAAKSLRLILTGDDEVVA